MFPAWERFTIAIGPTGRALVGIALAATVFSVIVVLAPIGIAITAVQNLTKERP